MTSQETIRKLSQDAHDPIINPPILVGLKVVPALTSIQIPGIDSSKILPTFRKIYDNNHDKLGYTNNDIYSEKTETELVTRSLRETGFILLKDRHTSILAEIIKNSTAEMRTNDPKFLEFAFVSAIASLFSELGIKDSIQKLIVEIDPPSTTENYSGFVNMERYEVALRKVFGDYFITKIAEEINKNTR
jgi:hypothetical protein